MSTALSSVRISMRPYLAVGLATARSVAGLPGVWIDRARKRAELAELTDRQIRDVGLDIHEVRRESLKPFWMS